MTELRPTRAQTLAAAEVIGKHLKPALLREEPAFAELSGTRVLVVGVGGIVGEGLRATGGGEAWGGV